MESARISSWTELLVHLSANWSAREPIAQRTNVIVDGQSLEVGAVNVLDAIWIEVVGSLGSARNISPLFALERNFQVPIGAIELRAGELVIRQRMPLDHARLVDIDAVLRELAAQCARGVRELRP